MAKGEGQQRPSESPESCSSRLSPGSSLVPLSGQCHRTLCLPALHPVAKGYLVLGASAYPRISQQKVAQGGALLSLTKNIYRKT